MESATLVQATSMPRREPVLPNGVLGMLAFTVCELMFFAGLISAHIIAKSSVPVWPPPGQPRLPVEATALNTLALLASGLLLATSHRAFAQSPARGQRRLALAILFGLGFVGGQGLEWGRLLHQGLTLTSSNHGAFFYLIIGAHALHACVALFALAWLWVRSLRRPLPASMLMTAAIFWYFVVGVWPVLYLQVYL